jgi:hypothetical protein
VHAENTTVPQPISVEIVSPSSIDSVPVHDDVIKVRITNNSSQTLYHLASYLTIVDVGRKQTYPVDEFGENAYQTRAIDSLAPGEKLVIDYPVHIMYVGQFCFTASVIQYDSNQVTTSDAVNVTMKAVSNLNRPLVYSVAGIVPIVLAGGAFLVTKGKTKKETV